MNLDSAADWLPHPAYLGAGAVILALLGAVHALFWFRGRPRRVTRMDWLLVLVGLAAGCFAVERAALWQEARVKELVASFLPMHAQMVEEVGRGKIILHTGEGGASPAAGGPVETGSGAAPAQQRGRWVIGFVPMYNQEGQVQAVLDVDYITQRSEEAVDAVRRMGIGVLISLFLAVAGIVVYSRMQKEHTEAEIENERVLRESEGRFRSVFEGSPDAIFVQDGEGRTVDVNPMACQLLGAPREELLEKHLRSLVRRENGGNSGEGAIDDTVLAHAADEDVRLSTGGEHPVLVEVRSRQIVYRDAPALLFHMRNVQERVRLEEELRQAQKLQGIGQLAAGVAHDFNNLLTVIQGHTIMMIENHTGDVRLIESLKEVAAAAGRAADLTRDLLSFGRKQHMRMEPLDVNEMVKEFADLFGQALSDRIELEVEARAEPSTIRADRGMLGQLITDLLANARDAMAGGGRLLLRTTNSGSIPGQANETTDSDRNRYVVIQVEDTGVGMDAETRDRIFEPFFTTKDVGEGSGLGLASAHGTVAQHGGVIEVESVPGVGSVFSVYLPEVQGPFASDREHPEEPEQIKGGHETILIVEDEPALRELAASNLERFGYRVIKAANGREALELWQSVKDEVDLLLTDMVMPEGISGRQLGERLSAQDRRLPIVYMSGYSEDILGAPGKEEFRKPFLQKPYAPAALARTVRATLDAC